MGGEFKNNLESQLLSDRELEMIAMQRSLQASLLNEFEAKFGSFQQTITTRNSFVKLVCPLYDGILLMICRPNIDVIKFPHDVSRVIRVIQNNSIMQEIMAYSR